MWDRFIQLVKNDEMVALLKNCCDRCIQAFDTIYDFEEMVSGSFWQIDYRFYQISMASLYERYCYAMSMIANQFHEKYKTLYGGNEAYEGGITFVVALNKFTDTIFEDRTEGIGFRDGTIFYYDEEYTDDNHDKFWDKHWDEKNQILSVREAFTVDERKWEFGFHPDDDDYDENLQTCNKDFLHIQKIIETDVDLDVELFLNKSKREYLPMIIDAFSQEPIQEPITDMFNKRKKWWQFWK